jgi:ribosomal protein S21
MNKSVVPDLAEIRPIRDGLEIVVVAGDIERAVRLLKRRMLTDGTLRALKSRALNPKKSDRQKQKSLRAARHRKRHQARKAASAAKDTS